MSNQHKDDGGPAFPQYETQNGNKIANEHGQGGMSLRDYFAAAVLNGAIASSTATERGAFSKSAWAKSAYEYADAMLAERTK